MNNNNLYDQDNWYAPMQPGREEEKPTEKKRDRRRKRAGRGLTPARVAGLVLLLLLVIAGTSIAFRSVGDSPEIQVIFPEDWD